jgi:nucleoside 2-deoxyribosyltransferase
VRAYIAGPLFNQAEKAFNLAVDARLRGLGMTTYLPQRDGGEGVVMVAAGMDPRAVSEQLFTADTEAIRAADVLVAILDGRVPDEGTCVELGIAYAWNTPCHALQTDIRRFGGDDNNLMIDAILASRSTTLEELETQLVRSYPGLSPTATAAGAES